MDFELDGAQAAVLARVDAALAQGPEDELFERLRSAGLAALNPLAATLAAERLSRAGAVTPFAVHALVLPLLFETDPGGVAAIAGTRGEGPVAFGAQANLLIRFEGDTAAAYRCDPARGTATQANYIYPLGRAVPEGQAIGRAPAAAVRRRMRLALAAEAVGALDAALAMTASYLTGREQFGRPLGAFQALQHRAAELAVRVEGARWLTRTAAWSDQDEDAALAAAHATRAARRMAWEAHQLHGARGFTDAYGLGRHTLRLQYLSIAMGGPGAHGGDAGRARWL